MKYLVIMEKANDGGFGAYAPDLPGCVVGGRTVGETLDLMQGAIEMHLGGMREDGTEIPEPTTAAAVYVEAA